jgi:response regulator RpfG family c-di-GMP phosphodiesterase
MVAQACQGPPPAAVAPVEKNTKHPATILVVDDEPLNLAVLSRLLNPLYRVLATRSGASAVALAEAEQPDLILLDVKMPGMDGHAVLAALQQQEATRDIPVIFVSTLGDDGDEELGLALGAVDYVVKPVRPAVVLARVRTQLEIKQHRDRLRQENGSLEQALARRVDELLLARRLDSTLDTPRTEADVLPPAAREAALALADALEAVQAACARPWPPRRSPHRHRRR